MHSYESATTRLVQQELRLSPVVQLGTYQLPIDEPADSGSEREEQELLHANVRGIQRPSRHVLKDVYAGRQGWLRAG